jgi:hypothetical protein
MQRQEDVKNLEVRSKILHKTLGSKIYPRLVPKVLTPEQAAVEVKNKSSQKASEWGDMLDDYFTAAKQLDDLQHSMKSVFSVHIPVPRKIFEEGYSAFPLPQILSTMIPKEDRSLVIVDPDPSTYESAKELKHIERRIVQEHNEKIEHVLEHFAVLVEDHRREVKESNSLIAETARATKQARKRHRMD